MRSRPPVVQDRFEQIQVTAGRYFGEEVAADEFHPLGQPTGSDHRTGFGDALAAADVDDPGKPGRVVAGRDLGAILADRFPMGRPVITVSTRRP
ncbi:MAG: hypothetical protein WCF33_24420 [Pseudonocardiaceae bacterium]